MVLISPQCLIALTLRPVLPCDSSALYQRLRSVLQSLPACPSAQTLPAHLPLSPSNREQRRERVERASRKKNTNTPWGKRDQREKRKEREEETEQSGIEREQRGIERAGGYSPPWTLNHPHLPLKSAGVERGKRFGMMPQELSFLCLCVALGP